MATTVYGNVNPYGGGLLEIDSAEQVYLTYETSETGDTYSISCKVGIRATSNAISLESGSQFRGKVEIYDAAYSDDPAGDFGSASINPPFSLSKGSSKQLLTKTYTYEKSKTGATSKTIRIMSDFSWMLTHSLKSGAWADEATASNSSYKAQSFSIPRKNRYTLKFNANGGTGTAPSDITKWHNEAVTLPGNPFTRVGYVFKGWSTSSTGSTQIREAGSSYNGNGVSDGVTINFYAIWESTYVAPTISNLTASRARWDADTSAYVEDDEEGTVAHVKFNYTDAIEDGNTLGMTFKVGLKLRSASSYTYTTVTGTDGLVDAYITSPAVSVTGYYDVQALIKIASQTGGDSHADVTRTTYISRVYFIIDINDDGTGIAFGRVSAEAMFECGMAAKFFNSIRLFNNTSLAGYDTNGDFNSLVSLNDNNALVIGWGPYDNELGRTYLEGNGVSIVSKNGVSINDDTSVTGTVTASDGFISQGHVSAIGTVVNGTRASGAGTVGTSYSTVASVALTPGTWVITGYNSFNGSYNGSSIAAGTRRVLITPTSTGTADADEGSGMVYVAAGTHAIARTMRIVTITANTTFYLRAKSAQSCDSPYGNLKAVRIA